MKWTELVPPISAALTFLGLVTVWLQPILRNKAAKSKKAAILKSTVALYLDALEIKVSVAVNRLSHGLDLIPKGIAFEEINRVDFQALERLLGESETIDLDDRACLVRFIRSFKTSYNMISIKQFRSFLEELRNTELRRIFPRAKDLDAEINALLIADAPSSPSRT